MEKMSDEWAVWLLECHTSQGYTAEQLIALENWIRSTKDVL